MRKIILIIGMLVLSITSYAQTFTVGTINYAITSTSPATVEVKDSPNATGDLVIPATVDNGGTTYIVTSIGFEAFQDNQLTSATIPVGVTSIGSHAFQLNSLTSVIIPTGVTSIGSQAFALNSLTSISIPASVTSIGDGAFQGNQLANISMPGVISIGDSVFDTNNLTSITIPASVTSIGNQAFVGNPLTSVTVEHTTPLAIGADVFAGSTLANLTLNVPAGAKAAYQAADVWKTFGTIVAPAGVGDLFTVGTINYKITSTSPYTVEIQDSPSATGDLVIPATVENSGTTYTVTSIGNNAFDNNSLSSVVIPIGVITIGNNAFSNNSLVPRLRIPDGVTSIGNSAFESSDVAFIRIPASVSSIGINAFKVQFLRNVTVDHTTPLAIDASVFGSEGVPSIPLSVPANSLSAYKAASVWKDFGNFLFTINSVNYEITSTNPPEVAVGESFFAVGDVVFPATVENEGTTYAVTSIGDHAFIQNEALTSVIIPEGVTYIGDMTFASNLITSVTIPSSVTQIGSQAFSSNQLTNVIIPDGVISIERGAFDFNKLTGVTIPSSVTSIEDEAFNNNQLASIIIPASVTDIGNSAFAMNQLTSISIPDGVTSISERTFENNKLTSISLPSSVTSIESNAFANNSLTSFVIPASVTSIGSAAFHTNKLTSVTIPSSITSIGDAVFGNNSFTNFVIPNGIISIGNGAFFNNKLVSITISTSVTSIDENAFAKNQLTSITVENSTPLTITANVFTDSDLSKATLNVPAGAKTAYQAADVWKTFGTIIAPPAVGDLFTVGTINYKITSISPATVEVQDSPSATGVVVIPASVDNNGATFSVTSIGEEAFSENSLTSITIPDGVTKIGIKAFQMNQLTSVNIPASVTSMGHDAFFTNQLTGVTIPAGLTEIDGYAFGSNALTSVVIPEGVTRIDLGAFSDNKLTSISLPASLTSISPEAFVRNLLTIVTVENPIPVAIDANVFQGSDLSKATLNVPASAVAAYQAADVWKDFGTIKSLAPAVGDLFTVGTINYKVTSISPATVEVQDSPSATGDVVIPATVDNNGNTYNVTSIGNGAFSENQLTTVTIPTGLTSIGNGAFASNQLTSINIPDGVTHIGEEAFEGNQIASATIPVGVTSISHRAFSNNGLTSISIPVGVTSIGSSAFERNQLSNVIIPMGVISIGDNAFGLNNLSSVTIPNSVTSISNGAFFMNSLTSITIPASVTTIGSGTFSDNQITSISMPGVISIGESAFLGNKLASYSIPDIVTSIGSEAFKYNELTSVTIPSSVTSIGTEAFAENQLTSVTAVHTTPLVIDANLFSGSTLTNATLNVPSDAISAYQAADVWKTFGTIKSIGPAVGDLFTVGTINYKITSISPATVEVQDSPSAIGDVVIPATVDDNSITYMVTVIAASAFSSNQLTSVSIPDGVTHIGEGAFGNNQLTSISIPSSVTSISGGTFESNQLTSVSMPGVTSIGFDAFRFNNLASVTIPVGVTSIGGFAFQSNSLTSVTVENPTPVIIEANVFEGATFANLTLSVPAGAVAAYQAAVVWKDFGRIAETNVNIVVASAIAGTLTQAELSAAGITQTDLSADQITAISAKIVLASPAPNTTAELQVIVDAFIAEENAVNAVVESATAGTLTEAELTAAGITQTELNADQIDIITIQIASADPVPSTTAELQVIVDSAIAEENAVNIVVESSIADTLTEEELIAAGISQSNLTTDQVAVISLRTFLSEPAPNTTAELQVIVDAAISEEAAVNAVVAAAFEGTLNQEVLTAAGVTQTDLTELQLEAITTEIVSFEPVPNSALELQDLVDFVLTLVLSVDDLLVDKNKLLVYPNPTKGVLNIDATTKILAIEIYDINGQMISTTPDLSNALDGVYFVKITTVKGTETRHIIKY